MGLTDAGGSPADAKWKDEEGGDMFAKPCTGGAFMMRTGNKESGQIFKCNDDSWCYFEDSASSGAVCSSWHPFSAQKLDSVGTCTLRNAHTGGYLSKTPGDDGVLTTESTPPPMAFSKKSADPKS